MRRYSLASAEARNDVDLRDHTNVIVEAVHAIMPNASVNVSENSYLVDPTPSRSDAVKIGRLICKSDLRKHCIMIPKLFTSEEMEEVTDNGENGKPNKNPDGGHH